MSESNKNQQSQSDKIGLVAEIEAKVSAAKDTIKKAVKDTAVAYSDLEGAKMSGEDKEINRATSAYNKAVKEELVVRTKLAQSKYKDNKGNELMYEPEAEAKGCFHVLLDKPSYSPKTGEKRSVAYIKKFGRAAWHHFLRHYATLGYTVKVLWNPDIYEL